MHKSVKIVGGGIIGLYLARELSRNGIDTELFESKRRIGEGAERASGILSKAGLERLGISPGRSLVNELDGVVVESNGRVMRVRSRNTEAYVLDRGIMAESMAREAIDAGATIHTGRRLSIPELRALADEEANILVGADGAVSSVARGFGFDGIEEHILTYKAEFSGARIRDTRSVGLVFSKDIAYRFFGWIVPYSDSKVEVGVGTSVKGGMNSREAFDRLVRIGMVREYISDAECVGRHASIIPIARRRHTVIGNVMLVGDAAGQTKATTGGGIVFGMSCANVAVESISRHIERGAPLGYYERAWRSRYGLDLRMHDILHTFYSEFDGSFSRIIGMANRLGIDRFFSTYGDMDSPSLMLKRLFFRYIFG